MKVATELRGNRWHISIEVARSRGLFTVTVPWDATPIEDDVFLLKLTETLQRLRTNGATGGPS